MFSCGITSTVSSIWVLRVLLLLISPFLGEMSSNDPQADILTKDTFIARCKAAGDIPSPGYTCESLWEAFAPSFQCPSTDCTPVTEKLEYSEFINIIPPVTPVNKTLFYSGTKTAAANIGKNCVDKGTIETTFLGRIFDGGIWCCARGDEIDVTCSQEKSCTDQVQTLFWTSASEVFAKEAKGYPAAVLNGSADKPPYREDSIFTTTEVQSLTPDVVSMTVILVYDNGGEAGSRKWRCNSPTSRLDQLHADLAKKDIGYNCTDNLWYSSEECVHSSAWTTVPSLFYILWLLVSLMWII